MPKERLRKWRKDNADHIREYKRQWCEDNAEHVRIGNIANCTGLDKELIRQYLLERGDVTVCDICQQECSTGKKLALDHDHDTQEIRGLLCNRCNTSMGKFNDDIKLLEKVIEYLKKHRK